LPFSLTLTQAPKLDHLDLEEKSCVELQKTYLGYQLHVKRNAGEALLNKIAQGIKDKKDVQEFQLQCQQKLRRQHENLSPVERGETFTIPQLCLPWEKELVSLEREQLFPDAGFDPMPYYQPLDSQDFSLDEMTQIWQADMNGEKITIAKWEDDRQIAFEGFDSKSLFKIF